MNRNRRWVGFVLLLLVAAALRFYRLGTPDLWGDEAFSISLSSSPLTTVLAGASDTHPPLYPFLLFVWLTLIGSTAFATRSLAALTGILAVPLTYILARRLVPSRSRVAWFSAALTTISPLLIYYSQETRMYEQVAVLSLASTYFCIATFWPGTDSGSPKEEFPKHVVAYFLTSLAAVYTHYSAFFVLAAQNALLIPAAWRDRRSLAAGHLTRWLVVQAVIVVCYIPWIIVQSSFLRGKASTRFEDWSWRGVESVFGRTFIAFGAGLTTDFPIAQMGAATFLICAGIGLVVVSRSGDRRLALAPLYFAVPVFVAWVLDPVMPFFYERYVLVALPGFYLLVALGWERLTSKSASAAAFLAAVLVLISGFSLLQYYHNEEYAKGKYGQMMAFVQGQAQPGDALILSNPLQKPLFEYYRPHGISAFYLPDGTPLEDPSTRQELASIAGKYSRLWLVMFGNPSEYDPTGFLERWLGSHAFKTYAHGFVDSALSLYVMPQESASAVHEPVGARLGDAILLASYDLDRGHIAPGQTLQLTLHWQATGAVNRSYKVFTHLLGVQNPETGLSVWAQMDGEPVGGTRPTSGWSAGDVVTDLYGLQIPPNAPEGEYVLEVGMYDPETLERLAVLDNAGVRMSDDRIELGTVKVR